MAGIQASTLRSALAPLADLLVAIGTVLVLWYGTHEVLVGTMTSGFLLVFLVYLTRLYSPLHNLSKLTICGRKGAPWSGPRTCSPTVHPYVF